MSQQQLLSFSPIHADMLFQKQDSHKQGYNPDLIARYNQYRLSRNRDRQEFLNIEQDITDEYNKARAERDRHHQEALALGEDSTADEDDGELSSEDEN